MGSEQRQTPCGKATAGSDPPWQHLAGRVIARRQFEEPAPAPEEWQDHLRSLEQWVCELLINNQELRMAPESATAQEEETQDD